MTRNDFIRWDKFRKIGKSKYILLMSLFFIIVANITANPLKHKLTIMYIIVDIILLGSIGVIFGEITWYRSEKMYKDYIKKVD